MMFMFIIQNLLKYLYHLIVIPMILKNHLIRYIKLFIFIIINIFSYLNIHVFLIQNQILLKV